MQLLLQPCAHADARKHFVDTIEQPVAISRMLPFLPPPEQQSIQSTFGDAVAVWGVTPGTSGGNVKKWERLSIGDTALFCQDNAFFLKATVAFKIHNASLAEQLWGKQGDGATWEYMFFLTDIEPVDVKVPDFNRAANYDAGYVVRGFSVLGDSISEEILEQLNLSGGSGPSVAEPASVASAKAALQRLSGNLNMSASARRRTEQGLLRTILLSNRETEDCAICGSELPVDLLVIGHIRKRHSCSDDQKKDLANVMPICLLGCDRLFEGGYLHVNDAGVVCGPLTATSPSRLHQVLKSLNGKSCGAFNDASAPFFKWHREHLTVAC